MFDEIREYEELAQICVEHFDKLPEEVKPAATKVLALHLTHKKMMEEMPEEAEHWTAVWSRRVRKLRDHNYVDPLGIKHEPIKLEEVTFSDEEY